jgi:flagellar assembly factor FliW
VRIDTTRFGEVDIPEDKVISFPRGILGFDRLKAYFLMDYKDTSIKWLQAVDDPSVAFMVVDPFLFFPEYSPDISPVEKQLLEADYPADLVVMAIMNVRRDETPPQVTLNLQAPLVFNASKMRGFQIVMEKSRFGVREPINMNSGSGQREAVAG